MMRFGVTLTVLRMLCCSGVIAGNQEIDAFEGPTYGWVTEPEYETLREHPRLFVSAEQLQRAVAGRGEEFSDLYDNVATAAVEALEDQENPLAGESVWRRAILMQDRSMALILQWYLTEDRAYIDSLLQHIEAMRTWGNRRSVGLPEGQFATVVAITYDLLYDELSEDERTRLIQIARHDFLLPFLSRTAPSDPEDRLPEERRSWWQDNLSNWNPVSSSGNGVLALAMYDEIPEAQTVIDRVNETYGVIFDYVVETEGGWVEGLGYWNWSMRYMSQFLISYERATGQEHDGFRSEGFRQALTFGTYFVPNSKATGFGNNQHGRISPQLAAAMEQIGDADGLSRLMEFFVTQEEAYRERFALEAAQTDDPGEYRRRGGGDWLLMLPDVPQELPAPRENKIHTFPRQGWSMLADQWPNPNMYVAVRGGRLGGHHTHQDLLSWHGVLGSEHMILNLTASDYYQTAWGSRAHEIYEKGSASKNLLFIGGLAAYQGRPRQRGGSHAEAHATEYQLDAGPALRFDATAAYWLTRGEPHVVARMFVILEDRGALVLDRVNTRGVHPVETRAHTEKQATFEEQSVHLEGKSENARMTYAADVSAILREATGLLTDGSRTPPTVLRWQTHGREGRVTFASFLSRGDDEYDVTVDDEGDQITVTVSSGDWSRTLEFDGELKPIPND